MNFYPDNLLTALIFFLLTLSASGQAENSGSVSAKIYTETHTYITKNGQNLDMDIYLPDEDLVVDKPVLLYVHGGGFQGGKRNSKSNIDFCTRIAKNGFVAVSISYRLTRKNKKNGFGCECPASEKIKTFYAAVEDLQDATFYLIENRIEFGIDPQKIILAGSSAGAETVLNAAFEPPYCYGLNSGPVDYAGVISFAGAIPDTTKIFEESAIPSLLFHGTDDNLVPYSTAPHHYCDKNDVGYLVLHGSHTIAQKLDALNVPFWLHTTCGAAHELATLPKTKYFDAIIEFCNEFVLNSNGESRHTIIEGKKQNENFETFKFCVQ